MSLETNPSRQSKETPAINPATGEVLGRFSEHRPAQVIAAVAQARRAQQVWAALPVRKRVRALRPMRRFLVEQADRIAAIISMDNGKTRVEALATEVMPAVMALGYYSRKAPGFLRTRAQSPGSLLLWNKWSKIRRVPYGVVGIISPWNYPFAIPFSDIVPALLAGNAVFFKAATQTQVVAWILTQCVATAELPEGLFNHFNLPGAVAGDALLEAGIDKLFFTGSVAVGKQLMRKAADTLTPVNLELGGNDPMLVDADADLDRAVLGAVWGGLQNCGQSCAGVERVYLHRAIHEPFLERLKEAVGRLRTGPDRTHGVDLGAITTAGQKHTIEKHVADALAKGARLFARSPQPDPAEIGIFYPATVLTEVTADMLVMREETFGPVLAVAKVADMEQAVRLANDSPYGLSASVWSRDTHRAEQIARRLEAGVITLNDHLMSHGMAETPWGGCKRSGIGTTHGRIGFDEMTRPRVIVHDLLAKAKRDLWWHPYSPELYRGLRAALDTFYGPGLWRRVTGLFPLLRVYPRIFHSRWDSGKKDEKHGRRC